MPAGNLKKDNLQSAGDVASNIRRFFLSLLILFLCSSAFAQSPFDGFDPGADGDVNALAVQSDGKIIVGGSFTNIAGVVNNYLARLYPDGSIDTAFTNIPDGVVNALALQSDGKIIVGGDFTSTGGYVSDKIARLNTDGSIDTAFTNFLDNSVETIAVQDDDKIVVGGYFTAVNGQTHNYIARFNADGTVDTTFTNSADNSIHVLLIDNEDRILVGGAFTSFDGYPRNYFAALWSDGSMDNTITNGASDYVLSIGVQPDGKIVVGGQFATFGGDAHNYLARMNADGSMDTAFTTGADLNVYDIVVQPDGKILLAGAFSTVGAQPRQGIALLNWDGSVNNSFTNGCSGVDSVFAAALQPDGKIVVGGNFTQFAGETRDRIARLYPEGSLDTTIVDGTDDYIYCTSIDRDGKIFLGGDFLSLAGYGRERFGALKPDGSLDNTIFTNGVSDRINTMALQPDGKVVIGGLFTNCAGQVRDYSARFNAGGSLDATFTNNANNFFNSLMLQPDGKMIVGGAFTTIAGQSRGRIARLNAGGALDTAFTNNVAGNVHTVAIQPDGKVILGGAFTAIDGQPRNYIGRLNSDGSLDTTFTNGAGNMVDSLAVHPDGKILVGGNFTTLAGQPRDYIGRLNPDGSLDTTFTNSANGAVYTMVQQTDGKIIIGGVFTTYAGQPKNYLARLNPDGSLDNTFTNDASSYVYSLAIQPDGKIVVGGNFTNLAGQARSRIGRLATPEAAIQELNVSSNGTSAIWLRSGANPVIWRATLETSTNGVTWESPVEGTWVTNGWAFTGLSLLVGEVGWVRASGHAVCGYDNNSHSIYESVRMFYLPAPPSPPVVQNGMPTDITNNAAYLNGNLASDGGSPTAVWIYWGLSNGDTNKLSWDTDEYLGIRSPGALWTNVTGLISSTQYFYRCYASNAYGDAWAAATTNFWTTGGGNDTDSDGMDDTWETFWFGSISNANENTDYDGDGLPDVEEYNNGGNPTTNDTDGDAFSDYVEYINGTVITNGTLFPSYPYREWTRVVGDTGMNREGQIGAFTNFVVVGGWANESFDGQTHLGGRDNCLTKYSEDGAKDWTRFWGSTNEEYVLGIFVTENGQIFSCGETSGEFDGQTNAGSLDAYLTLHDSAGNKLWSRFVGSPSNDTAVYCTVSTNTIYLTGSAEGSIDAQPFAGDSDVFLSCFETNGSHQWTKMWGSSNYDAAACVTVSDDGWVYVVGKTDGSFGGETNANPGTYDAFLTKLDGSGNIQWSRIFGSTDANSSYGVETDSNGDIYVSGESLGGSMLGQPETGGGDAFIAKYDSAGNLLWSDLWGSTNYNRGRRLSINDGNDIYVAGHTGGSFDGEPYPGTCPAFFSKYDISGTRQWSRIWGAAGGSGTETVGRNIEAPSPGVIYVGGYVSASNSFDLQSLTGTRDFFVSKWIDAPSSNSPPVVQNGMPTDITNNAAYLNGNLASDGGSPTEVWIYWGLGDGNTNKLSWQSNEYFGARSPGALWTNVTGLISSTQYFYRCYASNAYGDAWAAATTNFWTTGGGASAPEIENEPPMVLSDSEAVMYGDLLSTGGAPTEVWVYWGLTDGFTSKPAWATNHYLGFMELGVVSNYVGGLMENTEYHYRFYASNSLGDVWAPESTNFWTQPAGGGGSNEQFEVLMPDWTMMGQPTTFTVEAWQGTNIWNAYTGTVFFECADAGALPSNYTFTAADNGTRIFTNALTFTNWGNHIEVHVEDIVDTNMWGDAHNIAVFNGYGSSLDDLLIFNVGDSVTTGEYTTVSVAAIDVGFSLYTSYVGTVEFTSSDPLAYLPENGTSNYVFSGGDAGVKTFTNLQFNTMGEHWLRVDDFSDTNAWDAQWDITVQGDGFDTNVDHFAVEVNHNAITGSWENIAIRTRNSFEMGIQDFSGMLSISCSDPAALFGGATNQMMSISDHGDLYLDNFIKFQTPGIHSIDVFWVGNPAITGRADNIYVGTESMGGGGPTNSQPVLFLDPIAVVGIPLTIAVEMRKDDGMIDTNFVGTVEFDCQDTGATYSSFYNFTGSENGVAILSNDLIFANGGRYDFSVWEQSDTNNECDTDIEVYIGGATNTAMFDIKIYPEPLISNVLHDVYVVALGEDGLVNTSHSNDIVFNSSDPLAQYAANPCGGFTNGIALLSNQINLRSLGDQTVYVAIDGNTNINSETTVRVVGGIMRYVSEANGSNGNDGMTPTSAWRDIQYAAYNMPPYGVAIVECGHYSESVVIASTSNMWQSFIADQDGRFFDKVGPVEVEPTAGQPAFKVQGRPSIAIRGFEIQNQPGATGIVAQSANSLYLYDIEIDNCNAGILVQVSPYAQILHCEIEQVTGFGIKIGGNAPGVRVENNDIFASDYGIVVDGLTTNIAVIDNELEYQSNNGITFMTGAKGEISDNVILHGSANGIKVMGTNSWAHIHHNIVCSNFFAGISFSSAMPSASTINNNTLYGNSKGIEVLSTPGTLIRNNIMADNTAAGITVDGTSTNGLICEYNCLFNTMNWGGVATQGVGSIISDPLFASTTPGDEDFHLMSSAGRYDETTGWVNDGMDSPCVDAGWPSASYESEPAPNGGRMNMGAYGNTWEASKSPGAATVELAIYGDPSQFGSPSPFYGTNILNYGTTVVCNAGGDMQIMSTQYTCVGWAGSGDAPTFGTTTNTSFAISNNSTLTWTWHTNYWLDISADPNGTNDTPNGWYTGGTNLNVTAIPFGNYHFVEWTGDISDTNNPLNLTMDQGYSISPLFMQDSNTLDVASEHGMPDPMPGVWWYFEHPAVTAMVEGVEIVMNTQYVCTGWAGSGAVPTSGSTTSTVFTLTNDSTITWLWDTNYWLSISADPNGTNDMPDGYYPSGTNLTITATPYGAYSFAGWTGDVTSTNNPLVLTMDQGYYITPTFILDTNSLDVSSDYGMTDPMTGFWWYPKGEVITATVDGTWIDMDTQYVCTGWAGSGAVPTSGSTTSTVFTLTNDSTITWLWDTNFSLTVSPDPNGSVDVADGWYASGTNFNLTAIPSNGYSFLQWTGDITSTNNPLNLTMDQAYSLSAVYQAATNSLTTTSPHGTPYPAAGVTWHVEGSLVDAFVTPSPVNAGNTRYVCAGWLGSGSVPVSGAGTNTSFTITNNSTLAWNWTTQHMYTATAGPGGYVVVTNGWYDEATPVVAALAVASNGYTFSGWTGDIVSGANPLDTAIDQPYAVVANFTVNQYTITASAGANGSIAPSGPVAVNHGASQMFTITPDADYHIDDVTVDGPSIGTPSTYTFNSVTNNHTINAAFAVDVGSIRCFLYPPAARSAGAQFRVDGGAWRNHGASENNLPVTTLHTIQFRAVTGWNTPGNINNVPVTDGATTDRNGTYIGLGMVQLADGTPTFRMGVYDGIGGNNVTLSPFQIDITEVTVGDYMAFANDTGFGMPPLPTGWADWASHSSTPIRNVKWNEAAAYAAWAGKCLPTEAQFEFAMRSGYNYPNDKRYSYGDDITTLQANFADYYGTEPSEVSMYPATPNYGLRDIAGNVWEWCYDWHSDTLPSGTDPQGPATGEYKCKRGGAWINPQSNLRCARRYTARPRVRYEDVGFRCVYPNGSGRIPDGDTNDNGVPDWWEMWYFGLSAGGAGGSFDASADSDGDGSTNAQEYNNGTDPTDPNSVFAISAEQLTGPNRFVMRWPSGANPRWYRIEKTTNFSIWTGIVSNIPSVTPPNPYTMAINVYTDVTADASAWYRLVVNTSPE